MSVLLPAMKILVAPLNWGLGHATRCIPLVKKYLDQGDEVVLGGDGDSLLRLRQAFPSLRFMPLAPLKMQYGTGNRQVFAMLRALPELIRFSMRDRRLLEQFYADERFDLIISDNRFGLFSARLHAHTRFVYMTHQLFIRLPHGWRWLEGIVYRFHRKIWSRFDEVWVPDYASMEHCLSGALSHGKHSLPDKVHYIGPLSRFIPSVSPDTSYNTVILLSGPEPQRTIWEKRLIAEYGSRSEQVLLIRGIMGEPMVRRRHDRMTIVPRMSDEALAAVLSGAKHIVCRSGYSTIMDLAALQVLDKAILYPTPGQSEQEYLAEWHQSAKASK